MRKSSKVRILMVIAALFSFLTSGGFAQGRDGASEVSAEDFLKSSAAQSYQTGNYAEALQLLDGLLKAHPKDLLLLRYRAMALDQLGRSQEAVSAFRAILQEFPDHTPSRYFLGVAYDRIGDQDSAVKEWKWVALNGEGTPYQQWATENLERTALAAAPQRLEAPRWNLAGRYGYEYDSNVILKPDDEALASASGDDAGRHVLDVVLRNRALTRRDTAVDLQFAARQSLHDSGLDEFNFTSLEFGLNVRKRVKIFDRDTVLGARYDLLGGFLDGNLFSFKNRGTFSADTRFTTRTRTVISYRLTGSEYGPDGSDPSRTSRDGIYHDLGLTQYFYSEDFKQHFFVRGEYNVASARGGNFDSHGATFRAGVHTPLVWKTDLDVSGGYQYATYPHFESLSTLDTDRRRDSEWDFYTSLTHYLTPEIGIRGFYRLITTDNPNGFFEYDRNIVGVQVLYSKSY